MGGKAGHDLGFLDNGGDIARLIAGFDWSSTSLGPIERWPGHLRTSVALALRSPVPIVMLFGQDGIMIYNDAYAVFADKRHPQSLGARVREAWPEVADFNDNVIRVVLGGGALTYRDQELTLERKGQPESVWLNLDYSPIPDESGRPVGVIVVVVETTGKVKVERTLANERERLRQMFEQAPGFMAMLSGPDHVFDLTNAGYMQLIGHRDVLGKPIREALPDVSGQGYFELLDRVYSTGEPFVGNALKVVLQRSPGAPLEERLVDFVYQPVRDASGEVVGIFVEGIDITDRVIAERALRESETQFRTFAEAMPNHVWTSPPDGLLDWFNSQVYEFSGAVPGELDGQAWAKIVHPDDLAAAGARWAEALASGERYETEFRLRRADGVYRWHIARAVLIRGADGAPLRWIGTNTDIHEQKSIAEELARSEVRLRLSQEAAGIASLEVDIASGQVFGAKALWDLWGLPAAESVHISVLENAVIPEDRHIRSNEDTRHSGTAVPAVNYRIHRADTGEQRWIARHIEFLNDESGTPTKMFGVMRDVTEEKEAEARQQMLTHELEHRIKNILATVSALASLTLRNTDLDLPAAP